MKKTSRKPRRKTDARFADLHRNRRRRRREGEHRAQHGEGFANHCLRPRLAAMRMRSALRRMKPAASA